MAVNNLTLIFLAGGLTLALLLATSTPNRGANLKPLLGAVFLLAAFIVPPAIIGNLVAGSAGLLFLVGSTAAPVVSPHGVVPTPVASVASVADPVRAFALNDGSGVVVFQEVDGRMVSRFYRGRANV